MTEKNYYLMLPDPPWAGPTATVLDGPDVQVNGGTFLQDVDEPYRIRLSVDSNADTPADFPPCDIHGPSRQLLFSRRFVDVLEAQGVDTVQYFDADVTYEPTGRKLDYVVANVVGSASGLDMEQSDVIVSPQGNVLAIEEMTLDEDKLQHQKICRLQEDIMLMVVQKRLKEAIESAGLTGFLFVTDEEYEPGMI